MKSILFLLVSAFPILAQIQREAPPSLDSYLAVSTEIGTIPEVSAPRVEGSIQGVTDNTAPIRTSESIVEEVQANQTRLSYLYKKAVFQGADISRYYDLTLTIAGNGDVEKVSIRGITNKEFLSNMESAVKTWSFSKVKDDKSKTVNLKHLDFMFRKELVMP